MGSLEAEGAAATEAASLPPHLAEVIQELTRLGGERGLNGLPQYKFANGKEVVARHSPLLEADSLERYHQDHCTAPATAAAIAETLRWRQRVLPGEKEAATVLQSDAVRRLRDTQRFCLLGQNKDGFPVFAIHWSWGYFVPDGFTEVDMMRLAVLQAEEAMEQAERSGHKKVVVLSFGGPPPSAFIRAIKRLAEKHYPGRLERAAIYPVPAFLVYTANTMLAYTFGEQRSLVTLATTEEQLIECLALKDGSILPTMWRGGFEAVLQNNKVDMMVCNALVVQFLNPFASSGRELDVALEGPWLFGASAVRGNEEGPRQGTKGCKIVEATDAKLQSFCNSYGFCNDMVAWLSEALLSKAEDEEEQGSVVSYYDGGETILASAAVRAGAPPKALEAPDGRSPFQEEADAAAKEEADAAAKEDDEDKRTAADADADGEVDVAKSPGRRDD